MVVHSGGLFKSLKVLHVHVVNVSFSQVGSVKTGRWRSVQTLFR